MKLLKYSLHALVLGALAVTTISTVVLYSKVTKLQKATEITNSCNLSQDKLGTVPKKEGTVPKNEGTVPKVREMKILGWQQQANDEVQIYFSEAPDMEVVRHYVTAEPLQNGELSFSYDTWNRSTWRYDGHTLVVRGDFAYGTNVTLRIRKGFPVNDKELSTNDVAKALAEDFAFTFRRKDELPKVGFADEGRYLPPIGPRAVTITSINVPEILSQIRRVPSANIVELLALENNAYDKIHRDYYDGAETFVTDISDEPYESAVPTMNRLNVIENTPLAVRPGDGSPSNGVFLVSVSALKEKTENGYTGIDGTTRHRVVCISDIGISVRKDDSDIFVWATSLTRGVPIADAKVEIYSSANILVAKGTTDKGGWCRTETVHRGTPFAAVVSAKDGSDRSFIALTDRMGVTESDGLWRENHLATNEVSAFVWTDRGIYRHDEKIFIHAILRNGGGSAPAKFPMELSLVSPGGKTVARKSGIFADDFGAVSVDDFSVGADLPSGKWTIRLSTPGKDGRVFGSREVKVEEFAPPTIRVKVEADKDAKPRDFGFAVSAEHLYGGPAASLKCEGEIVFEDVPFAPKGWDGWSFGNDDRGISPYYCKLAMDALDAAGRHVFPAPLPGNTGKPKAVLKATAQGSVFEPGGRPASARDTAFLHYYPFYVGTTLGGWLKKPEVGSAVISVACVAPDGKRIDETRKLVAKLESVDCHYTYRRGRDGWATWNAERIRSTAVENIAIEVPAGGDAAFEIPAARCGDYVLTIDDPDTGASFSKSFYLSEWGDEAVRAPLENPTKVAISTDKPFYRVGESPRLVVRSPFAGTALLTVMRDSLVHSEVIALSNATSEVVLPPCETSWAPNVDVRLSVVAGVAAGSKGLSVRAHGESTVVVKPVEREIPVAISVRKPKDGEVSVSIAAPGADRVAVTLVDEGINILTDEPVPNPIGFFATPRTGELAHGLFDLYHAILPVLGDDALKANGVKTGGGFGAELLGRVSPVPSRRFKPLSLWSNDVEVRDGKAQISFSIPEFVGEVRVTAVAYSARATGSKSAREKICPAIVTEPDAPRFVAPGDRFLVTLPVDNRSGEDAEVSYRIAATSEIANGSIRLAKGERTVLRFYANAPSMPGEMNIVFAVSGSGEKHEKTIDLPVRPAMPWRETAGVELLDPGEKFAIPPCGKFFHEISGSPVAELSAAYDWLAEYPHGCLEQTSSRIFPLLHLRPDSSACQVPADRLASVIAAGVARVTSMIRQNDFTMWPDASYAPWDREVSLYAAHFLAEASLARDSAGRTLFPLDNRVRRFLKRWSLSSTNSISAYACHTLAIAGDPERDRMFRLYDDRENLDLLSRARLARAFVRIHDGKRAEELLKNACTPENVKEAAFLLLALTELDHDDKRAPALVTYLLESRDKTRFSWGTTSENAHALLALGAWYGAHPPKEGSPKTETKDGVIRNVGSVPAFVSWKRLDLPSAEEDRDESTDLSIRREYFAADGSPYDLANARATDIVHVKLTLKSAIERDYADLVIEDLLPGAFEPVRAPSRSGMPGRGMPGWMLRSDARDDRMLVFSKKFHMRKDDEVEFTYPVRIVSPGEFALPGVAVEGMYHPGLRARARGARIVVRD